jgi:hypothetical protein
MYQVSRAPTRQRSSGTRTQNGADQDSTHELASFSVVAAEDLAASTSRKAAACPPSTAVCSWSCVDDRGRWAPARRATGGPRNWLTR